MMTFYISPTEINLETSEKKGENWLSLSNDYADIDECLHFLDFPKSRGIFDPLNGSVKESLCQK